VLQTKMINKQRGEASMSV